MIFGPLAGRIINFYPRSPRGERRQAQRGQPGRKKISIHAPREGSDRYFFVVVCQCNISIHAPREGSDYWLSSDVHFYPRSPRGERRNCPTLSFTI